ncbi:hypothetical protein BKA62DRAFT_621194 [Auriculariales sp. MPI-PUGE-AT-0066]|nr:hypothetical protein BKA62DRAFT_621194 [Auriculariales sp. MPI-PUGE-AT-0066]
MTGSYPLEKDSYESWNERFYLNGVLLGAVAYGVHATLFFSTLQLLWARSRSSWKDWVWIFYIFALFVISSVGNGGDLKFAQMIWIDNRNFPGGPTVYIVASCRCLQQHCYIINSWLQDGLLLYRVWVIFNGRVSAIVLPGIVFLTTAGERSRFMFISSASLTLTHSSRDILLSQPTMTIWSTLAYPIFTSYWSISIGFNALCTTVIVIRLIMLRMKAVQLMADSYASISAIFIESAALYTITGIVFIVLYATNSSILNLFLPTLAQVQSIAPLLIILRVAQGTALSADALSRLKNPYSGFSPNTSAWMTQQKTHANTLVMSRDNGQRPRPTIGM